MATVIRKSVELYHLIVNSRDPRTQDWFLTGSVWPVLGILATYWMFVFKWGPSFMKNRKPYSLDRVIQVYNALQVVCCSHLVYAGIVSAYGPGGPYHWACEPVDFSNSPEAINIASKVHIYFLLKVLDLLDTVFFVLRKKQNQVTFLHVYHHMGMVAFAYNGAVFMPGGQGVMLGLVNCVVHVVMYAYYFVTIWNPEYKKNIWWKKHITQLQILQFLILFLHNAVLLLAEDCGYPKFTAMFLMPQFFFFMLLFTDFYRKSYT